MATEIAEKVFPIDTSCPICGHLNIQDFLQAPDRFHGRKQMYQLLRCSSCSMVWLDNPPKPEEMDRHYSPDYNLSIAEAGESSPRRWRERRKVLVQYKSGGRILDLGCSSGSFLATLQGQSWELYGIEITEEVAKKAQAICGAKVFVGSILDASFPSETFDAITCFHVFEHLYRPHEVMARVFSWLKPGGIFYMLTPNISSGAARVFKSYWYGLELPRHLYHYSPVSLKYIANSVGLQAVSVTTHREVFFEQSTCYILDGILEKSGILRPPLAKYQPVSLPFRVVRKMFRLSLLPVLTGMISMAGDGESIHAVFRK